MSYRVDRLQKAVTMLNQVAQILYDEANFTPLYVFHKHIKSLKNLIEKEIRRDTWQQPN